jgi:FkbM family methyltransferase
MVSFTCLVISVVLFVFSDPSANLTTTDIYLTPILSETEQQAAVVEPKAGLLGSAPASLSGHLLGVGIWADNVWKDLIQEASNLKTKEGIEDPGIFVEVGMYQALQCLQAAQAGLEAHCVEPSKVNFARVLSRVHQVSEEVQNRMHLHNVAAGSVTGRKLNFHSAGGTGDRVGHVDIWKMEQNPQEEPTAMIEVTEMRMDDIVMEQPNGAFLMKIDTQGFEPHVFNGLTETLKNHKAKFIMLEYWPKGMDIMTAKIGDCSSVPVLQQLAEAGYTLYQLPFTAHPAAPKEWKHAAKNRDLNEPLDDFAKNCQWYYDLEQRFPSEEYKMGYWSDVLAVAPNVHLSRPTTTLGRLLFPSALDQVGTTGSKR